MGMGVVLRGEGGFSSSVNAASTLFTSGMDPPRSPLFCTDQDFPMTDQTLYQSVLERVNLARTKAGRPSSGAPGSGRYPPPRPRGGGVPRTPAPWVRPLGSRPDPSPRVLERSVLGMFPSLFWGDAWMGCIESKCSNLFATHKKRNEQKHGE